VERHQTGTVDLRQFWTRRARRLVPALLLCFPLVALVVLLSPERPTSGLVLDAVAAATWVANWRFIFAEQTYADLFALPSPFQHFWSLAVEEQFYLFFPLVLLAVLGVGAARARTGRLAVLLGLLVVASTVQAARLHAEHGPLGHAYYGTDARLAEILVGSMLALALVGPEGVRALSRWTRRAISAAGCAGLAGLVVLMLTLEKDADLTYRGGFLLAACCTGAVVAACLQPTSPVTRLLAWRPLVWLGVLSYGVYLFHWPLFQLLSARYTGLDGVPLLALRVSLVLGLAWLSYTLLERPVRNGGLPARPAIGGWATGAVAGVVIVAAASTAVTLPTTSPSCRTRRRRPAPGP
jgi:peptidoglycan/LPS O-acetylase OafA/YrhL